MLTISKMGDGHYEVQLDHHNTVSLVCIGKRMTAEAAKALVSPMEAYRLSKLGNKAIVVLRKAPEPTRNHRGRPGRGEGRLTR